jgi:hypothetical protein
MDVVFTASRGFLGADGLVSINTSYGCPISMKVLFLDSFWRGGGVFSFYTLFVFFQFLIMFFCLLTFLHFVLLLFTVPGSVLLPLF